MSSSPPSTPPSPGCSNVFSMRIVSLDYYMAAPIPGLDFCDSPCFQGREVDEVPIIRIYGSTLAGQKTCLHIHRALPYLYIPCSELEMSKEGQQHIYEVSNVVERALQGTCGSKRQHVHGCCLVRAKKFYGYHSVEELFVKIYLYRPADVARAATLLLAGSVLNRSIQPYESHIPFLLQFMVDCNLYGMSQLHTSQVKFRQPLPDKFLPRAACHSSLADSLMEKPSSVFESSQTGLSIWLSSTVPEAWTWTSNDELFLNDKSCIKRQSICELEGDSGIDDILNQNAKMYTSFSQTSPDAKMVQSLVPIWEEERERSGLQEYITSPEVGKPSPETVLKSFCDAFQYENGLSDVFAEAKKKSSGDGFPLDDNMTFEQPLQSTPDTCSTLMPAKNEKLTPSGAENVQISKGLSAQSLTATRKPEKKVSDAETLRLLSWLTSSQAVSDDILDDELLPEAILSPQLLSNRFEKAFEKAHLEYEIASQQECQDILDSLKGFPSDDQDEASTSTVGDPLKVIPQVDGSTDEKISFPQGEQAFKLGPRRKVMMEMASTSSFSGRETKKSRIFQDPQPFSAEKMRPDVLCDSDERKNRAGATCLSLTDADESYEEPGTETEQKLAFDEERGQTIYLAGDEVRSRYFHHTKQFEHGQCLSKDAVIEMNQHCQINEAEEHGSKSCDNYGYSVLGSHNALVESCFPENNRSIICPEGMTITVPLTDNPSEAVQPTEWGSSADLYLQDNTQSKDVNPHKSLGTEEHLDASRGSVEEIDGRVLQMNDPTEKQSDAICNLLFKCSGRYWSSPIDDMHAVNDQKGNEAGDSLKSLTCSLKASSFPVNNDSGVVERQVTEKTFSDVHLSNLGIGMPSPFLNENAFIEMTLDRRPPVILKTNDISSNLGHLCDFHQDIDTANQFHLKDKRKLLGVPPFFGGDDVDEGAHKSALSGPFLETIDGIPLNFQNDGSCSYILSFAVCPPSRQSVSRWLFGQKKKISHLFTDSSSAKDDCLENLTESCDDCNQDIQIIPSEIVETDSPKSISKNFVGRSCEGDVNTELRNQLESESSNIEIKLSASSYCDISQLSGQSEKTKLTPLSQTGFRDPARCGSSQNLTLLSLEIQAETRGSLLPDPQFDAINLICLAIQEDTDHTTKFYVLMRSATVKSSGRNVDGLSGCVFLTFPEELLLFDNMVKIITSHDPDILLGWEVQGSSLGYLAERARYLGIHLLKSISRTPDFDTKQNAKRSIDHNEESTDKLTSETVIESLVVDHGIIEDEWGRAHASGIHVGGRIVLNVWRLMRSELRLNLYTIEAVAEEVLRRKIPSLPYSTLNGWFSSGAQRARFRCIEYALERANLNLQIMNQLDMANRTSELARVFGIDFFSVLSRGSQFRVESMLLRLLHSQNYLATSPGYQQVASQPAMECLPLVMEPESGFYTDPVIVLDFQSLYPSMIIAYNLCYSTCLGKVLPSTGNRLGVSSFSPDPRLLLDLKENMLLSPNGIMYVSTKVRKGVLPRLLEEILSTRIMVKKAMKKLTPSQQVLHRILNARQLALKLIANVTYGYTAAGFSGRMPCAELADSIVQCGRKTLEKSISFINSHSKWSARVVYGDTDSMFVLLQGRSREEAFEIGREIASTITSMNPEPVMLKMEKVYHPCFLLTKKRYVGYSYESPGQIKPPFDAKGIETVRRDACPAVSKTLERSLRLFFEQQDISQVKKYLQRQWGRILSGRVSLQDFIFAKEVRLGSYSSASLPPAAIVAVKAMKVDRRREPRYGERVPYVVVHGEPGARLVDMVVDPLELLEVNSPYRLNDLYYIKKQIIPVLQRAFGLIGVDLHRWFSETPRPLRAAATKRLPLVGSVRAPLRSRIDLYYLSRNCSLCSNLVNGPAFLCDGCATEGSSAGAAILIGKTSKLERDLHHLSDICQHCGGGDWIIESGVKCTSLACSVFFERRKAQKELISLSSVAAKAGFYPECALEWF